MLYLLRIGNDEITIFMLEVFVLRCTETSCVLCFLGKFSKWATTFQAKLPMSLRRRVSRGNDVESRGATTKSHARQRRCLQGKCWQNSLSFCEKEQENNTQIFIRMCGDATTVSVGHPLLCLTAILNILKVAEFFLKVSKIFLQLQKNILQLSKYCNHGDGNQGFLRC